ncbi:MAG: prephenate dehydrogenase/arogenate dehydrogenase family protein [Deltaproteobacteria bacterium]|nr:prephenate dehydrogenase/arogenate dehydrogenase family protein [Deltaproteobacteria bacterium]
MKDITIGIIGGTGGIGRWFARYFQREGFAVSVWGKETGFDSRQVADTSDVVIIGVPIGETCSVIERIGPYLNARSLLMDLTSLKAGPVAAMLASSAAEVIGLHPLFGPSLRSMSGQNIVYCPARCKKWLPWVKEVLERGGARLLESTPERHDELMSYVQVLTHLNTITMGLVLEKAGVDPAEIRRFSTPVFRTKLSFIQKVCEKNPLLSAEIIAGNPHAADILSRYEESLGELRDLIEDGDASAIVDRIRK